MFYFTDCWLFQQSVQKLYEEAEDSCVRLSGELLSTLLSKPFPGGFGMTSRGTYTVKKQLGLLTDTGEPSSTRCGCVDTRRLSGAFCSVVVFLSP